MSNIEHTEHTENGKTDDDSTERDEQHSDADAASDAKALTEMIEVSEKTVIVDVELSVETLTAIAYRSGRRSAEGGPVSAFDIHEIAHDHVQLWPRFLVKNTETPIHEWVEEAAGVPVDDSEPIPRIDGESEAGAVLVERLLDDDLRQRIEDHIDATDGSDSFKDYIQIAVECQLQQGGF